MDLMTDIEVPEAVVGEFRRGFHVHAALAASRQARVNESCRQMESRLMDGIGQLRYRVDADLYFLAVHKFGRKCWSDPAFLRDCEKRGVLEKVRGKTDRVTVLGRNLPIKSAVKRRVDLVGNGKDRSDLSDLTDRSDLGGTQ
jgi:hypothetical protein